MGRGARRAWTATAAQRAAAKKAAGRGLRGARGIAWDAIKAAAAGLWALRSRKHRSGALGRLREAWQRHRRNRANKGQPAIPESDVATSVRRPTATTPVPIAGGPAMNGMHFVAPAEEAVRAAAAYSPTGMLQVGQDFAALKHALDLHAQAMRTTVEKADAEFPLDPRIIELLQQVYGLQLKAAEMAGELEPAFRKHHEVDIARIENPRKGHTAERMWDVSSNL